jgi:signal transduction histidine kinase
VEFDSSVTIEAIHRRKDGTMFPGEVRLGLLGIAHDFNNILMPIFGYIELAMPTLPKASATREYLDQVYQAAKRAKDLVKQILTFSRQEAQGKTAIQIHIIIQEALKLLRTSIPPLLK